ncbi:uncharacterized protein LOC121814016 [Haplochromis burtoni]|uniref:uncharacterized protein LOC121814016 n=1 Tax=Haplochromis burtoni TaxID=8153 RepID=UPI001C2CED47|nr:uncharacterized protein LOC121814016 [Haplochromis burtoni]
MRLATIKKRVVKSDYDARFKDRLQLNSQTGALTITQLSVQDSGIYKWQAISDTILWKQFNLTVYCKYIRSLASLDLEDNLIKRQHFFPTLIHEKMHNNSLLLLCLDTLASISPHFYILPGIGRLGKPGIEPPTFQLVADLLYHLSHSHPSMCSSSFPHTTQLQILFILVPVSEPCIIAGLIPLSLLLLPFFHKSVGDLPTPIPPCLHSLLHLSCAFTVPLHSCYLNSSTFAISTP